MHSTPRNIFKEKTTRSSKHLELEALYEWVNGATKECAAYTTIKEIHRIYIYFLWCPPPLFYTLLCEFLSQKVGRWLQKLIMTFKLIELGMWTSFLVLFFLNDSPREIDVEGASTRGGRQLWLPSQVRPYLTQWWWRFSINWIALSED